MKFASKERHADSTAALALVVALIDCLVADGKLDPMRADAIRSKASELASGPSIRQTEAQEIIQASRDLD
jgi:hypothetical protein